MAAVAIDRAFGLPAQHRLLFEFIANESGRLVPRATGRTSTAEVELAGTPFRGGISSISLGTTEHVVRFRQGSAIRKELQGPDLELRVSPISVAITGQPGLQTSRVHLRLVILDLGKRLPLLKQQFILPTDYDQLYATVANLQDFRVSNAAFTGLAHMTTLILDNRVLAGGVIRTQKLETDEGEYTDAWALYFTPAAPLADGFIREETARPFYCLVLPYDIQANESSSTASRFVASISGLLSTVAATQRRPELYQFVDGQWTQETLPSDLGVLLVSVRLARRHENLHANDLLEFD